MRKYCKHREVIIKKGYRFNGYVKCGQCDKPIEIREVNELEHGMGFISKKSHKEGDVTVYDEIELLEISVRGKEK